ncbi:MAG: putative ABC exporter domain-containing protein, partial [Candidatus Hinthialibacter sp.]
MISPSLVQLLRLRYKSRIRNTLRSLKTARGVLYFSIAAVFFLLWLGPQIMLAFHEQENESQLFFSPDAIEALLPLGLFAYGVMHVIMNLGGRAIYFTPAEIDFLFSAPFHRKELLLYKIFSNAMTLIFTSLFIAVFTFRFTHHFICAAVGFFLMINFMNHFSLAALLIKQIVTGFAYTRFRRIALGAAGLLLAAGCWQVAGYASSIGWIEAMQRFQSSLAGVIMIGVFVPFAKTLAAHDILREMLPWASIALLLDVVLVYGILQLDANYYERAEAVSQKIYQAAQRKKSGQGSPFISSKSESKSSLFMLPAWGGIGPIVWRQFTTAYRNSKILFLLLPILCLTMGPILFSQGMSSRTITPLIMVLV